MAGRHRTPVGPQRLSERRHGDRRVAPPRPRRTLRIRLAVVLVLSATASSMLVHSALDASHDADEVVVRQELLELAAVRLQAMRVTERAHLELFAAAAGAGPAEPARLEAVLDAWQADMAEVAQMAPVDAATSEVRSSARQLREVIAVETFPLGAGDPVLSARTQLMPTQNRLVEGAGQSGLGGADGVADRTTEHLYVLGIATDVAVAASANRPEAAGAWTSFGIAIRTLGGAGGLGVLTAGPLSGWVAGPAAAERLTGLVTPLVTELGSKAPDATYLATLAWALAELDLVGAPDAAPTVSVPTADAGLAGLLGGIDPGLVSSVLGALTPAVGQGPPMEIGAVLDESERLVADVTSRGRELTIDRIAELRADEDATRTTAAYLLAGAAAVVAAAVALLLMLVVAARRAQRLSEEDSMIDPLTGLLNRSGFAAEVGAVGPSADTWVVLIDLDRFKPVNDSYGHAVGDAVLRAVADEIDAGSTAVGGVAARLGGDEFAVAVPDSSAHDVDLAVAGMIERLEVITIDGRRIELGCSVGVVHGAPGVDVAQLLTEADLAMYRAKRSGRGRSVHFDDASRTALAAFRDGTIGGSVDVMVRLQRSLGDRSIVGALVHPQVAGAGGEVIDGADLRLIAEFSGRRFGVLDATIDGIRRSGRPIPPAGLRLWFEVTAPDVVAFGGADALWQRLATVGLSGAKLGVELIDAGGQDPEALATAVAELRSHGVHVAVAGTGPGAVGLAALAKVSADRLVIDASAVEAVRSGDREVVRAVGAVAGLGAHLGAEVIAVGVPSLDVAHTLVEMGVGVAQVVTTEPWAPVPHGRRDGAVVVN